MFIKILLCIKIQFNAFTIFVKTYTKNSTIYSYILILFLEMKNKINGKKKTKILIKPKKVINNKYM